MMTRNYGIAIRLSILSILVLIAGSQIAAQPTEKKIALTFDKLPFMKPMGFWRPREISTMLLRALDKHSIQVAGFVVEEKVAEEPYSPILLNDWVTRGHVLGNQTWGDADFNVLSFDHFLEHVEDGQKTIRELARRQRFPYRYLRFPQLHHGNERRKRERLLKLLRRNDYEIAQVSVKTADFVFNPLYIENEQNSAAIEQLRTFYLEHMAATLHYAESQSQKVFGRNITHIMRLHIGIATARFLSDLIDQLKASGYSFVSFPEAMEDEAYATEESYVGPLGLTFIDRVAATRGLEFDEASGAGLSRSEVERRLKRDPGR